MVGGHSVATAHPANHSNFADPKPTLNSFRSLHSLDTDHSVDEIGIVAPETAPTLRSPAPPSCVPDLASFRACWS